MADLLVLAVRYLHILFAILWIGSLGFSVMVLRRFLPSLGLSARKEVLQKLIPVMIRFIPISAVLTIAFGAVLYLQLGNFDPTTLLSSTWGLIIFAALLLTLALFAFAVLVVIGASRRILVHLHEETCTHGPEVGALTKRFNNGQVIAFAWGVLILALMVYATQAL